MYKSASGIAEEFKIHRKRRLYKYLLSASVSTISGVLQFLLVFLGTSKHLFK